MREIFFLLFLFRFDYLVFLCVDGGVCMHACKKTFLGSVSWCVVFELGAMIPPRVSCPYVLRAMEVGTLDDNLFLFFINLY